MELWRSSSKAQQLRNLLQRHLQRAIRIRGRIHFTEEAFHLLLAGGVGILGGMVNVFSFYAIESVKALVLRRPGDPVEVAEVISPWQRVLIPVAGGLVAGLVLNWGLRLAGPKRTSNILEVVVAGDGRLPFRSAVVKFISSMVTIATGGSIGREGSITQLSATIASKWGQFLEWPPYRLRLLVGCGAASGISAAYNAPISGAVFAAIVVLGNFSMSLFAPLVFASVVATMVSRTFFGIKPWYIVPPYEFTRLTQLPWFLVLGVLAGLLGATFLKMLSRTEDWFSKLRVPVYYHLAVGGLVVGLLALYYPGVWGNGYVIANRIIRGEYAGTAFGPSDLVNVHSLAARLASPAADDKVTIFLEGQLSPATHQVISNHMAETTMELQQALAEELNRILRVGAIYEPDRFSGIQLSPEANRLLRKQPMGEALVRLNRLLVVDAYPNEIRVHRETATAAGALLFLTGLLIAKLVATLATVGSGAVGGVFTPTLFLGAGLGAAFGLALQQIGGGSNLPISPFAVVGMGSMLAATTHSPLLAMIMVFEISLEYSLMPPLMLACVVSVLVARRIHPASIYTEPLRRKGLILAQEASISDAATQKTVADIMRAPVPPIRETATLRDMADRFLTGANNFLPVVGPREQLLGVVALQDLKEHLSDNEPLPGVIAYDLMRPPPPCVTPNQRLLDVLPVVMASEIRNIPVVTTLLENRLVGSLARSEVLSIFSEAIAASRKTDPYASFPAGPENPKTGGS